MNGDVLTTLRYDHLFEYHRQSGAELTIACHRVSKKIDYGIIEFDGALRVTGYREKPSLSYDVSMGVYVFNRSALDLIKPGEYLDLPTVVSKLVQQGRAVKVYISDDLWLDIGRPDHYAQACEIFEANRERLLPEELPETLQPRVANIASDQTRTN